MKRPPLPKREKNSLIIAPVSALSTSSIPKKQRVFPNIAELAALLICGDCAAAGLIPFPASDVMGKLIIRVKAGGLQGLKGLHLISQDKKTQSSQVIDAVTAIHTFLNNQLTADEKSCMGYNIFMLEHSLCKFKRLMM